MTGPILADIWLCPGALAHFTLNHVPVFDFDFKMDERGAGN
jgi:hypothetical protein